MERKIKLEWYKFNSYEMFLKNDQGIFRNDNDIIFSNRKNGNQRTDEIDYPVQKTIAEHILKIKEGNEEVILDVIYRVTRYRRIEIIAKKEIDWKNFKEVIEGIIVEHCQKELRLMVDFDNFVFKPQN